MWNVDRVWNAAGGVVAIAMGALWFAGTLRTDPGLGRGLAHDVGNILAFYWMPTALLVVGVGMVVWNLWHLRNGSHTSGNG